MTAPWKLQNAVKQESNFSLKHAWEARAWGWLYGLVSRVLAYGICIRKGKGLHSCTCLQGQLS
eukprot:1150342-Pelagomonas_calceolata.AAC.10